jgi:hypothetical protein
MCRREGIGSVFLHRPATDRLFSLGLNQIRLTAAAHFISCISAAVSVYCADGICNGGGGCKQKQAAQKINDPPGE